MECEFFIIVTVGKCFHFENLKKKKINVSRIGVNTFEWRDASPMVIRFSHKGIELTFITINDFSQLLLIEQIDFFPYDEIHTLNIY